MLHVSLVRSPKVTLTIGGTDTTSFDSSKSAEFTDLGKHHVRLAVGHFRADASRELCPAALAETLFRETILCKGRSFVSPLLELEGGNSLIPTWVKPLAHGAMLLRLNETLGQRGSVKLKLADGYKAAVTDLRGKPNGSAVAQLNVDYKPYMLTTVCISR